MPAALQPALDWTIQPGFQMGSSDAEWKTDDRSSPGISESVKSVLLGGRRKPQDVIRSEGTDLSERCSPLWRKVWPVRLESWVWKLVLHLSGCGALSASWLWRWCKKTRGWGYISVNFQSCSLFWLFQYLTIQEVLYCYLFLMWKHNFCIRERSLRAATIITSVGFFWFFLLVGSLWGFRLMNIQIQSDWTGSDVINWPMARTYSIYFIVSVRINQVPTMGQDL